METVRWGIAGTGSIAGAMAGTLADVEGGEVVAVGSRSADRARAFADEHGIDRAHGSYQALAEDPGVDVVYVASPHSHHLEHTLLALRGGKHVLCEKAFARSANEARQMVAAAREHTRFLMEAMWTWFNPAIVEVRQRIADGDIGEVRAFRADFGFRIDATEGRMVDPALAGGSLLDMGIYPVATARFVLGPPTAVHAVGHLGPTGVDTNLGVLLGHDDGAVAAFHTSLEAQTSLTAEITGTAGRIVLDAPFWVPAGYVLHRAGDGPERHEVPNRGLAHEVEHVHERLAGGHRESDVLPLDTSVEMMATLDEIRAQIGLRFPDE